MPEISLLDYKLLKYIDKHGSTSISEINRKFGKKFAVISCRLSILSDNLKYIFHERDSTVTNTGRVKYEYRNSYIITDIGKTALNDYKAYRRDFKRNLWLKNVWIPILVSFLTNLLLSDILPWLKQIIKWVIHIP